MIFVKFDLIHLNSHYYLPQECLIKYIHIYIKVNLNNISMFCFVLNFNKGLRDSRILEEFDSIRENFGFVPSLNVTQELLKKQYFL